MSNIVDKPPLNTAVKLKAPKGNRRIGSEKKKCRKDFCKEKKKCIPALD